MHTRSRGKEGLLPLNLEIEKRAKFLRKQTRMAQVQENQAGGRSMSDYLAPDVEEHGSINIPNVEANNFAINPAILSMAAADRFGGMPTEDPNAHATKFLRLCGTFKINGVTQDAVRLRLFPFTLKDRAEDWLSSHPDNHFDTWDKLHGEFLKKFYPISKTQRMRRAIQNFKQLATESLTESWERFKELKRQCPHHGFQSWDLMMSFYEGLLDNSRILVDASSGGSFTILEPTQAEELLEKIAMNGSTWYTERSPQKLVGGIHDAGQLADLSTKLDNVVSLVQKLAQITSQNHNSGDCIDELNSQTSMEQVNMLGYNRPHQQSYQPQGTYHPNNSRNHPGFSWSNPVGAANPQHFVNRGPLGYQGTQVQSKFPVSEAPPQSNTEVLLEKLIKGQLEITERMDKMEARQNMVERQLANQPSISSTKVTGKLPAMPENPREHVNAIVTRSGKVLEEPPLPIKASIPKKTVEEKIEEILDGIEDEPIAVQNNPQVQKEVEKPVRRYVPPLPFPQNLETTKESRWKKFLEIVESLKVSVPLLDLLSQVPSYGKFLKEILAKKKKYGEREMVAVAQEYQALTPGIGRNIPKHRDPGKFTIPCVIGGRPLKGSLCDLGASVSVMPLTLCQGLGLGEPKPIQFTLEMADRSIVKPIGILEDVPVRVDKYFVPCDFIVIDVRRNLDVPLILGRPFLATIGAMIDARKGSMIFDFGEEKVEFNVLDEPKIIECKSILHIDPTLKVTHDEYLHLKSLWGDEIKLADQPG
jgi:hypothetical protein